MGRHLLQGCPHEENDPVTWVRHCEHIARILFFRVCAVAILIFILGIVITVMP